jgi:hypothetical protein
MLTISSEDFVISNLGSAARRLQLPTCWARIIFEG